MILSWELIKDKALQFVNSAYQLPTCYISSNPYGGYTGTYGLLNCLAINNGGVWAVVRFYYATGGSMGVILSYQNSQYPSPTGSYVPLAYIGTNGYLYISNCCPGFQLWLPLTIGWHTAIIGEYYSGGTYYVIAYLDTPSNTVSRSTTSLPQLFGWSGTTPYNYIGAGYASGWASAPSGWFFFDGLIQYIALYGGNSPSIQSALLQWLQQTGGKSLPPTISGAGPYALYLPIELSSDGSVWRDMSGNGNDVELQVETAPYMLSPAAIVLLPGE